MNTEQEAMNFHYQRMMTGVLSNAERDVLLARTANDPAALAKAQARLDTVQAALGIYAAAHKLAHGSRPWPRLEQLAKLRRSGKSTPNDSILPAARQKSLTPFGITDHKKRGLFMQAALAGEK